MALAGGSLRLPAGDWAATTSWWPRPPPGLQLPPPRLVMPLPDRREAEERGPGGPKCPPPSTAVGAPPRHKEPAIFHSFGFSQHRKNSSTQRFSPRTESQSQSLSNKDHSLRKARVNQSKFHDSTQTSEVADHKSDTKRELLCQTKLTKSEQSVCVCARICVSACVLACLRAYLRHSVS